MPLSAPVETNKEWIAALQLVLYSFRNFTVQKLRDLEAATGYGQQMGRLKNAASPAPGLCHTSSLLSGITKIRAHEVCISHTQFRDFLDSQLSGTGKDASREGKHVRRAHARIASWCLEYLCNTQDAEFRRFQPADENTSTPEFRDTFLSYAIRYWVPHLKLSDSDAETLASAGKFLAKSAHAASWAQAYWGLGNPATRGKGSSMSPFAIFAEHGVESLVNAVLETHGDHPPLTRSQYLGLKWAARNGHSQLVHKLLALEITGDEPFDSVIYEAFASGDAQISKEVVMAAQRQAGNIQSPLNLLSWAAYYGLAEIVDILIPCIPPEVEKENEWRPVRLTVAESKLFTGGSLQALKLLVAAGFSTRDVGIDNEESASALRLLCKSGASTEAVEFLAEALLASSISNTPEQKQEWPKEFASAGEIALAQGHHKVVQVLMQTSAAKEWYDVPRLVAWIGSAASAKETQCCREIVSHLLKAVESLKQPISSNSIRKAYSLGDVSLTEDIISASGGLTSENFSDSLCAAVLGGDAAISSIKFIEKVGFGVCSRETYQQGISEALWAACTRSAFKTVSLLLEKRPRLDEFSSERVTPLFYAAFHGHEELVRILLKGGAKPNDTGSVGGWKPIHGAFDNPKILDILINEGADINAENNGQTALSLSCRNDKAESVRLLLKHKAEVRFELSEALGKASMVALLLDCGADPLRYKAEELNSPLLHTCVRWNLTDILKMLLIYKVDVNERDMHDRAPLHYITSRVEVPVLKLLVDRGAYLNIVCDGKTPLSMAIGGNNKAVIRYLVEAGAAVNATIGYYGSVIHKACQSSDLETIKLLITHGAELNCNNDGILGTPLQAALQRNTYSAKDTVENANIIRYLLDHESSLVQMSSSTWGGPLSVACLRADLDVVKTLLERGANVHSVDKIGRMPIHSALYRTIEYVETLLDAGAELHVCDRMNRSPLHFAVVSGRLNLVKYVISQRKELVTQNDIDNWSPLMWAVRVCGLWGTQTSDRVDIIQVLLDGGASRLVEGEGVDRKWTAYDIARYYGHVPEIVELVTPSKDELATLDACQRGFWQWRFCEQEKKAYQWPFSCCDACLMRIVGTSYACDDCDAYFLCFKCYRSQNHIHPYHEFTSSEERFESDDDSEMASESDSELSE
ncbi:hypothetical protein J3458_012959 [Metarhizium acridum]|uniref:uncharacterized protein n=1 Tax=Metarhizium acridum TaxID=92637 RepID=UPI001C6BAF82|nr:hypothetical protein J3458_012959 [Metarhizium acridum]